MGKREIRWLYGELPDWVSGGLVTAESAARLRSRYGPLDEGSPKNIALILCGALGGVLIGGGIFLLLAHNWDALSRPARTAISFGLLVFAQVLAGWVIWKRAHSRAWCEGSAAFLMLAVGTAILLISKAYQIAGDPNAFVLAWMLLSIPLAYLTGASLPAIGFMIGITVWGASLPPNGYWYWPVAALVVPYLWSTARKPATDNWARILFGIAALILPIAVGVTLSGAIHAGWVMAQSTLLALMYLAGRRTRDSAPEPWQLPFLVVGMLGTVVICFVLSFKDPWDWVARGPSRPLIEPGGLGFDIALLAVLGAAAALMLWLEARRSGRSGILFALAPAFFVPAYLAVRGGYGAWIGVAVINLYFFALGVSTVVEGLIARRILKVNLGMLAIAALILARFFDSELGFVVRGIVFIFVGMGFLAANFWLVRKVKEVSREE